MALSVMQRKSLNEPDEVARYDLISTENVVLDGLEVHRVTFAPGAKWSRERPAAAKPSHSSRSSAMSMAELAWSSGSA